MAKIIKNSLPHYFFNKTVRLYLYTRPFAYLAITLCPLR